MSIEPVAEIINPICWECHTNLERSGKKPHCVSHEALPYGGGQHACCKRCGISTLCISEYACGDKAAVEARRRVFELALRDCLDHLADAQTRLDGFQNASHVNWIQTQIFRTQELIRSELGLRESTGCMAEIYIREKRYS